MSERSVRRIIKEPAAESLENRADTPQVGRPSKTERFRDDVVKMLTDEPGIMSLEVLRRLKLSGYGGGKSAVYEMVAGLRPPKTEYVVRFEGLPGEFSQHDFGTVIVRFMDGKTERVKFFASRLKYSRKVAVTLTPNEQVETLVRTLAAHLMEWGGVPLRCVFDRPKTIAIKWQGDGKVTQWNATFLHAAMDLGVAPELCWPRRPREKGAVENLVGWVKGSFFKQRRFQDMEDLRTQLAQWLREVNEERKSDATGVIPAVRFAEERPRLRPLRTSPDDLALRIPVMVGPTAHAVFETNRYALPPEAAGIPGTLFVHKDRIRVVAGKHCVELRRSFGRNQEITNGELRAARLAALTGKRARSYQKRQDILNLGDPAERFLTHLVHRRERSWIRDVDRIHDMLQEVGPQRLLDAIRSCLLDEVYGAEYVATFVRQPPRLPLPPVHPHQEVLR